MKVNDAYFKNSEEEEEEKKIKIQRKFLKLFRKQNKKGNQQVHEKTNFRLSVILRMLSSYYNNMKMNFIFNE